MNNVATHPAGPVENDDLRIVLFGPPGSGKTTLHDALVAASQRVGAGSGTKADKASGVYQRPGLAFVEQTPNRSVDTTRSLAIASAEQVAEADALILTIDATAGPEELQTQFTAFQQCLEAIEEERGERTEIAGLPVFVVLTKCDELAQSNDTVLDWKDRLEQRKREIDERFRDFVPHHFGNDEPAEAEGQRGASTSRFGDIDLHVWATSIKGPQLLDKPAQPRESHGIAELCRQVLTAAATYRHREEGSARRLTWLTAVSALVLAAMVSLTVMFVVAHHTDAAGVLASRVDDVRYLDRETPAERLRGSLEDLRRREKRLDDFEKDPDFASLKPDARDWVQNRHQEIITYLAYLEKLLLERSPAAERADDALTEQMNRLKTALALPQPDWAATAAGQRHKELLETAEAVQKSVRAARDWYEDERDRIAGELLTGRDAVNVEWASWATRAEKLLSPDRRLSFRPSDALPGTVGLTYETVLRFDRVLTARAGWESDRDRLRRLLDVSSALGLVPATAQRPAVLSFGPDFTLSQARERLSALEQAYPDYKKTFAREGLPLPPLARVIRSRYESLLVPARAEVLRQLKLGGSDKEETPKRWEAVRVWLKEPTELASWRQLALLLLRMEDPLADDPATVLGTFLNRETFDLTFDSVQIEIPASRLLVPRAEATLDLYAGGEGKSPTMTFRPSGEPRKDEDRRLTVYTFRGDGGRLRYKLGDKLWAKLPLRGGAQVLTWSESRSTLYQFERLRLPPRLQDEAAASILEGRTLDDVRLIVRPSEGVPTVPDLMPAVRLD